MRRPGDAESGGDRWIKGRVRRCVSVCEEGEKKSRLGHQQEWLWAYVDGTAVRGARPERVAREGHDSEGGRVALCMCVGRGGVVRKEGPQVVAWNMVRSSACEGILWRVGGRGEESEWVGER